MPQLAEVSQRLRRETGWEVAWVPALIPFSEFFALLANRRFPAATFVRRREDLDYLQEPDIFHEIFGHTPLLTHPDFAAFTEAYGRLGLAASKEDRVYLARLYWFTVEFGLIGQRDALNGITLADQRPAMDGGAGLSERERGRAMDGLDASANEAALNGIRTSDQRPAMDGGAGLSERERGRAMDGLDASANEAALNGIRASDQRPAMDGGAACADDTVATPPPSTSLKIYGGGILSSIGETGYALSGKPLLRPFDVIEVLRTPYRIDVMQPLYYVIESLAELKRLTQIDLMACVEQAKRLGLHAPLYPPKDEPAPGSRRAA